MSDASSCLNYNPHTLGAVPKRNTPTVLHAKCALVNCGRKENKVGIVYEKLILLVSAALISNVVFAIDNKKKYHQCV